MGDAVDGGARQADLDHVARNLEDLKNRFTAHLRWHHDSGDDLLRVRGEEPAAREGSPQIEKPGLAPAAASVSPRQHRVESGDSDQTETEQGPSGQAPTMIWSWKHNQWWGPNQAGYTPHVDLAGRYSQEDAGQIVTTHVVPLGHLVPVPESFALDGHVPEPLGCPE